MILFPAIDIQDGKVVRLLQGKFDQVTEYAHDPVHMARQWEAQGADWIHVIDLDGARTGTPQNSSTILDIADVLNIPVQTGGGIRGAGVIQTLLDGGVARVVLGTKAVEDRGFLAEMIQQWGSKIAVSLDCHNGMVAQDGWMTTSDLRAVDFVKELEALGLQCLIYTDIARDGMLNGPNIVALEALLQETTVPVIASGGIAHLEDVKRLVGLRDKGIVGAITGKALYEGTLDLKEALAIC